MNRTRPYGLNYTGIDQVDQTDQTRLNNRSWPKLIEMTNWGSIEVKQL